MKYLWKCSFSDFYTNTKLGFHDIVEKKSSIIQPWSFTRKSRLFQCLYVIFHCNSSLAYSSNCLHLKSFGLFWWMQNIRIIHFSGWNEMKWLRLSFIILWLLDNDFIFLPFRMETSILTKTKKGVVRFQRWSR